MLDTQDLCCIESTTLSPASNTACKQKGRKVMILRRFRLYSRKRWHTFRAVSYELQGYVLRPVEVTHFAQEPLLNLCC